MQNFGFVEFEDYRDADEAVYQKNGHFFLGDRVTVEIAQGTPHISDHEQWGTSGSYRVIVENLSSRVSWQVTI